MVEELFPDCPEGRVRKCGPQWVLQRKEVDKRERLGTGPALTGFAAQLGGGGFGPLQKVRGAVVVWGTPP